MNKRMTDTSSATGYKHRRHRSKIGKKKNRLNKEIRKYLDKRSEKQERTVLIIVN